MVSISSMSEWIFKIWTFSS